MAVVTSGAGWGLHFMIQQVPKTPIFDSKNRQKPAGFASNIELDDGKIYRWLNKTAGFIWFLWLRFSREHQSIASKDNAIDHGAKGTISIFWMMI